MKISILTLCYPLLIWLPLAIRGQVIQATNPDFLLYDAPVAMVQFNSESDEYAPFPVEKSDELYLTTERFGRAQIVITSLSNPANVTLAPGTLNRRTGHSSFLSMSTNGEIFSVGYFFYGRQVWPGIISVVRDGESLNTGHSIVEFNGEFFTSHPSVSPDGTRIVFSSNRAGGRGRLDLWYAERMPEGGWNAPVNISEAINSEENEITPFFVTNDTLLYASNGYGGKGGYDIFLTVLRNGDWTEPVPLDWVNSEFDDTDCVMLKDGTCIFASNRPGGKGGLDLYISRPR